LWGTVAKPEADHTPLSNIDVRNTLNVTLTLTHVVIIMRTALIFTDVFRPFENTLLTMNLISIMGVILTIYFSSQQEPNKHILSNSTIFQHPSATHPNSVML